MVRDGGMLILQAYILYILEVFGIIRFGVGNFH